MREKAYSISLATLVMGSLASLLLWLQGLSAYEEETGLVTPGAGTSVCVVLMCLLAVAGMLLCRAILKKYTAPETFEAALGGRTVFYPAAAAAIGLVILIGGMGLLVKAGEAEFPALRRLLGLGAVLSGACTAALALMTREGGKSGMKCFCASVPTLFCCLWLVVFFKEHSAEPVIWSFGPRILAISALALAFYSLAGFAFGRPNPRAAAGWTELAAFFMLMVVADGETMPEKLLLAGMCAAMFMFGFILIRNFKKPE